MIDKLLLKHWANAITFVLGVLVLVAVDGITQLFGWRESTWELRVITGTLFGLGNVWFLLPYMQKMLLESLSYRAAIESQRGCVGRELIEQHATYEFAPHAPQSDAR